MALDASLGAAVGALDLEVELSAGPGEVVVIVGPNGAGKTTLLRMLAGLHPLDRGHVDLDGVRLDDPAAGTFVAPRDRPIGMVFQDGLLFPHLDVLENVAFGLRSRGTGKDEARRRAHDWLDVVGLTASARARPRELSGGQRQQVALARALAVAPRLLLLDEPLAALDATARVELRRELRRQLDSYSGVRLLVTHDPIEAQALGSRIVVIEAGRVAQAGTPAEVRARPRSRYVADLVGVNLLRGRTTAGGVTLEGGAWLASADRVGGGDVLAVVHPHSVALHLHEPEGSPRNAWETLVESLDDEGERVRVQLGPPIPLVAEVTPAAVRDLGLRDGAPVWASVKATEVAVHPA